MTSQADQTAFLGALKVLERADPSRITDMLVETVCELLSEGPSDPDMLDMVTFEPMTYPVMLSTGFVLDYHTVLRLDRCPFTRKQFEYPLKVCTHSCTCLWRWIVSVACRYIDFLLFIFIWCCSYE